MTVTIHDQLPLRVLDSPFDHGMFNMGDDDFFLGFYH